MDTLQAFSGYIARNAAKCAAIAASIHFILIPKRTCVIFGQINGEYCSSKTGCLAKTGDKIEVIPGPGIVPTVSY